MTPILAGIAFVAALLFLAVIKSESRIVLLILAVGAALIALADR